MDRGAWGAAIHAQEGQFYTVFPFLLLSTLILGIKNEMKSRVKIINYSFYLNTSISLS